MNKELLAQFDSCYLYNLMLAWEKILDGKMIEIKRNYPYSENNEFDCNVLIHAIQDIKRELIKRDFRIN